MDTRPAEAVAPGVAEARERVFATIEAKLGRPLGETERVVDVVGNSLALERAKDALQAEIEKELRRVALAAARGTPSRIRVTDRMIRLLNALYEAGAQAAANEIRALGVEPRRDYADLNPRLGDIEGRLRAMLGGLSIRVEEEAVSATIGEASRAAIARSVMQIPGARGIAADLVSPAFARGLGSTYEQNRELFPGWIYSAMMDGATCDVCRALDGTEYDSWEAIQVVLPNGGPNPSCRGGSRCRCRAVPQAPDLDAISPDRVAPPPEYPPGPVGEILRARDEFDGLSGTDLANLRLGTGDLVAANGYPSRAFLDREEALRTIGTRVATEADERALRAVGSREAIEARAEKTREAYAAAMRAESDVYAEVQDELRARLYAGRPLGDLSDREWDALDAATNDHPRVVAATERKLTAARKHEKNAAALRNYDADVVVARRKAIAELLEEIRGPGGVGGTFDLVSTSGAMQTLSKKIAALFPRSWIEASNGYRAGLRVRKNAKGRGFYLHGDADRRAGFFGSTIQVSGRKGIVGSDPEGYAVGIHEFGHRFEYVIPEIRAWEWAFHSRRTALSPIEGHRQGGSLRDLVPGSGYRSSEISYPDGFVDPYVGKVYRGGTPESSWEIFTIGLEGILTGSYRVWDLDPEHRDFVLGLLFAVG